MGMMELINFGFSPLGFSPFDSHPFGLSPFGVSPITFSQIESGSICIGHISFILFQSKFVSAQSFSILLVCVTA